MLGAVLTGCWLTVASAGVGYDASLRAHTRARAPTLAERLQGGVATDVEVWPTLALRVKEQALELRLAYSPRLTVRQALGEPRPQLIHEGRLQGDWRVARGLRLLAEQHATYGTVDLFAQAPGLDTPGGEGVPLEPVPAGAVHFASSKTTLGAEATGLHPRLRLSGSVGYLLSGGLDGEARATMPLQRGPRARLDGRWNLSRMDSLTTAATLADSSFSSGARATLVQLDETWLHRFSRATDATLGAGLGVTSARAAGEESTRGGLLPAARASLGHRFHSRERPLEARLNLRVEPFLDRLNGGLYPRAEGTLLVTWTAASGLWLYGQGGGARALGGGPQAGSALALGALGARWSLKRGLNLETDVRGQWLRQPGQQQAERLHWAATFGLSATTTGMF
ncbi:hypothetical protein P2318_34230 [Myxococcaceae bacterium GXIMD 01537]